MQSRPITERFPFFRQIYEKRMNTNQNCFFLYYSDGQSGRGKSYLALAMAEALDKTFTIDRVVFTLRDFIHLAGSLPPRSIILFDDAGVESDSRSFMERKNKYLRYTIETMRSSQVSVFFTVPGHDQIESTVRNMTTFMFRVKDRGLAKVYLPKWHQYNRMYIYPALKDEEGNHVWVGNPIDYTERAPMPSKKLIEQYEMKKAAACDLWNKDFLDSLDKIEKKSKKLSTASIAKVIRKEGYAAYTNDKGKLDPSMIAFAFDCSEATGKTVVKMLKKL